MDFSALPPFLLCCPPARGLPDRERGNGGDCGCARKRSRKPELLRGDGGVGVGARRGAASGVARSLSQGPVTSFS